MSATPSPANVYYLPIPQPVAPTPPASRWTRFRRDARRAWWRLRLALAGLRLGRWRPLRSQRREDYAAFLEQVIGDGRGELIDRRRRPKPGRPATILDFEAARLRLRPRVD